MAQLAMSLSRQVRAVVVEETGLQGLFDFELQWTPDWLPKPTTSVPGQRVSLNGTEVDPDGPTLFTALREQLGLRLESQRGPTEVLVIDSASQPSPD